MPEFESPFPDWVAFATATTGEKGPLEPHPEELAALSPAAVGARRITFALGRTAARRAIEALGYEATPVLPDKDRAPIWPAGLVGSITHTAERALAAVAPAERTLGIGLDLEDVRRNISEHMDKLVADAAERQWIAGDPVRFISVFAAKEAIFKAFYPRHGAFFGFDAVHLDPAPDGFTATLRSPLADWPEASRCLVHCRQHGDHVLASLLLPPAQSADRDVS